MSDAPWLTIVGIGADGLAGLPPASQAALKAANIIIGPARHIGMLSDVPAQIIEWPVPFADGIEVLLSHRGASVVALASGDPFWFGAGSTLTAHLEPGEWRVIPAASCFSLAAAHLGWALQDTLCVGLHATPFERLRPHLAPDVRMIVTLRDGAAVADLAAYLRAENFGASTLTIFEDLGAPDQRITTTRVSDVTGTFTHPVCAAIRVSGDGEALSCTSGQRDDLFETDGQLTKRPVRAITLSTLAPKPHEHLWDIGGGSGSIAIEWLLSHPSTTATCIEPRADRAAFIDANARKFGLSHRLKIVQDKAPAGLSELSQPDAVFIGGGLSSDLLAAALTPGSRLVANAVTLEGEALLTEAQSRHGGDLMRIDIARSKPLGSKRGWSTIYPVVQWSFAR